MDRKSFAPIQLCCLAGRQFGGSDWCTSWAGGVKGQQRLKWACLTSSWASRRSLGSSEAHGRLDRVSPHDTRRPFCSLLFSQDIKRTPETGMTPKFILLPKLRLRRTQLAISQKGKFSLFVCLWWKVMEISTKDLLISWLYCEAKKSNRGGNDVFL